MAEMIAGKTARGFAVYTFRDGNGEECSLQKSSAAENDFIWLGCDDIGLKRFMPGKSWEPVPTEDDPVTGVSWIANTRMHLTREQVAELIPALQRFVDTGDL